MKHHTNRHIDHPYHQNKATQQAPSQEIFSECTSFKEVRMEKKDGVKTPPGRYTPPPHRAMQNGDHSPLKDNGCTAHQ